MNKAGGGIQEEFAIIAEQTKRLYSAMMVTAAMNANLIEYEKAKNEPAQNTEITPAAAL